MPTTDLPGPEERRAREQRIVNARPMPARRRQSLGRETIPVTVRLVWERDGEQQLETVARDWVGRDVLVDIADARWPTRGVWVDADDVTRRDPRAGRPACSPDNRDTACRVRQGGCQW